MPPNIVTTPDIQIRARMRRLLSPPFDTQYLLDQAPVLEKYANVVIDRLTEVYDHNISKAEETVSNMLDWTNFYTKDVIGDLAMRVFSLPWAELVSFLGRDSLHVLSRYDHCSSSGIFSRWAIPAPGFGTSVPSRAAKTAHGIHERQDPATYKPWYWSTRFPVAISSWNGGIIR